MKAGSLLNLILLLVFAGLLSAASFTAFKPEEIVSTDEAAIEAELSHSNEVRLNERDSVSGLEDATVDWSWDQPSETLSAELQAGTVYFSTLADDFTVEVVTPFARIESQNSEAVVRLSESGESLEVYALTHPSLVTFTLDGKDLNSLVVPTGNFMRVPSSKITATIERLRLTKLTKEFPVFAFEESDLTESELAAHEETIAAYDASALSFMQESQRDSHMGPDLTGLGSYLSKAYQLFRETLTVLPSAEDRYAEVQKGKYLVYGRTNLLFGDSLSGETWINEWKNSNPDLDEVDTLYSSLFFVLPGDELYPVKSAAAELLYPQEEPLTALRRQYQELESLLERGSLVEAQTAYTTYQSNFETALNSGDLDDEKYLGDISREYSLLELLLRSHAVFYNGDSVKLLSELENKILSLAGSDEDLDEERQAFVQSKLRYLENLFDFVVDRKVSIEDATELANELVADAESYLKAISSQVAVRSYFESKLAEYDVSIEFMNSPEFYSYDSFEEGLKEYQAKQLDLANLSEYLQSLRAEDDISATISLEDATKEAEDDLRSNGIQFRDLKSLGDSSNRLFELVDASTGGYTFEANYDRETHILYDTVVEGELRFSTGLALETASSVIVTTVELAELTPEEDTQDQVEDYEEEGTLTEEVAIKRAENAFDEEGLKVGAFKFKVLDLEENTFTFTGVLTEASLAVSGAFDLDTGVVSDIEWEYKDETQTLPDVELSEFEQALYDTYNALYGQQ